MSRVDAAADRLGRWHGRGHGRCAGFRWSFRREHPNFRMGRCAGPWDSSASKELQPARTGWLFTLQ